MDTVNNEKGAEGNKQSEMPWMNMCKEFKGKFDPDSFKKMFEEGMCCKMPSQKEEETNSQSKSESGCCSGK